VSNGPLFPISPAAEDAAARPVLSGDRERTAPPSIASGDRDFVPLASVAHTRNWEVEMCAFSASFNPGGDLATAVDRVRPLDASVFKVGRCDFDWPISAYTPGPSGT
jgi:hypothetical protein